MNPCCIDFGQRFQKGNGPPPIADLAPGIDVVANGSVARAEIAMVMDKCNEPRVGEGAAKPVKPMLLDARIAVSHGDGGELPASF